MSGSKKGEHRGGRKMGTPHRRMSLIRVAADLDGIDITQQMPLEYVLEVMRDPDRDFETRFAAAQVALPYCHPKLIAQVPAPPETPPGAAAAADPMRESIDHILDRFSKRPVIDVTPAKKGNGHGPN